MEKTRAEKLNIYGDILNMDIETQHSILAESYERLADYIHDNNISQLVGEGVSASPFTRIIKRAYKQRYGKEARPLNVVNLGLYANYIKHKSGNVPEAEELRNKLKINSKNTLILSETISSGISIRAVKRFIKQLKIPVKTAGLSCDEPGHVDFDVGLSKYGFDVPTYTGRGDYLYDYSRVDPSHPNRMVGAAKTQIHWKDFETLRPSIKPEYYPEYRAQLNVLINAVNLVKRKR